MRLAVIEVIESLRAEGAIKDYRFDLEGKVTSVYATDNDGNDKLIYRERGEAEYAYPLRQPD